jgi:hypothetical protein
MKNLEKVVRTEEMKERRDIAMLPRVNRSMCEE